MNKTQNTSVTGKTPIGTTNLGPTPRRGLKKEEVVAAVEKFAWPDHPITLKQACYALGMDHWYVVDFIKRNGTVVGDAPKEKGSRGKAAKLYALNLPKTAA